MPGTSEAGVSGHGPGSRDKAGLSLTVNAHGFTLLSFPFPRLTPLTPHSCFLTPSSKQAARTQSLPQALLSENPN